LWHKIIQIIKKNMSQNIDLLTMLKKAPDPRRSQGLRHPLPSTLFMIILATMGGCVGYREIGTYLRVNQEDFGAYLGLLKNRVPTYVTIRSILQWVDYEMLRSIFVEWAQKNRPQTPHSGFQIGIDGKCLRSTVTNGTNSEQNFVSMVTLFCKELGCIWEVKRLENGKISEMVSVQELLKTLEIKGFLFTLDALHLQKKRLN
jgi:hypothetical protein